MARCWSLWVVCKIPFELFLQRIQAFASLNVQRLNGGFFLYYENANPVAVNIIEKFQDE